MALKIWTFLLVMSLPAAEHGRGFGSLASVLSSIDYHEIQQKPYPDARNNGVNRPSSRPWPYDYSDDYDVVRHRPRKRAAPKITNKKHYAASAAAAADGRCMARVQSALGDMITATSDNHPHGAHTDKRGGGGNRRHTSGHTFGIMDLSGYALHQRLRTAPGAEMYVTGMRAKVMPASAAAATSPWDAVGAETGAADDNRHGNDRGQPPWARVDECRYDPLANVLEARMRFGRTLMVSGSVKLLYGAGGPTAAASETGCDMTLRLRPRAGLGFTAVPLTMPEKSPPNRLTATPTMTIRTTATFIDPDPAAVDPVTAATGDSTAAATYISVHSYNCVGGALAGFPGREQQWASSSDHLEQFPDDSSDELHSGVIDLDLDDESLADDEGGGDGESGGDRRVAAATGRRPSSSVSTASPSSAPFGAAGFVGSSATTLGPEPRLRRIQYHVPSNHHHHHHQQQHPLLTSTVDNQVKNDQLLMEMEDVFVRGVRSLLAKHMERTLKPVLKDSLMANMGYTVSYGR